MFRALTGGWLYALGDVNHHALLTHQGKYQARSAAAAIAARAAGQPVDPAPWGPSRRHRGHRAVPQVFFCDPPAGAVGLTADQAEHAGHRIRVVDVDLGVAVPGPGLHADGHTSRARVVLDEDHDHLPGVTFVGPGVEELIHSATIAVAGQVPDQRLWHAVPASPPSAKPGSASSKATALRAGSRWIADLTMWRRVAAPRLGAERPPGERNRAITMNWLERMDDGWSRTVGR